ncbi:hypothetical protein [Nonomuraea insulae]|uniref:Uncharacterized protein n=1 Tax=Nonomuraea insulae TaxID=1616787 RepID=A0ABW1D811_9ACTN
MDGRRQAGHPRRHRARVGPGQAIHDPPVGEEHHHVGVRGATGSCVTITIVWPSWLAAWRRMPSTSRAA